jgi:hypothetical protein
MDVQGIKEKISNFLSNASTDVSSATAFPSRPAFD